ncbi:choice-of-anchor L domain-containing protein [Polyangium jinanense]|uniref:Choice-of-anchor L domain-containing protein n=1 Tax=Polyangium jinanense TaxID=2829994 RepID=A0A9X3XDX8_9BACT|nr:choice-of-anchor L domain-containing protein [Polyangium jinanense]MDC3959870.1 choice-of-anchor L domain-containing protein [Polyangium jinanense]MDC3986321.1 choice-of-anchor L domain-containing protein [Polyangium jinanense]
MRTRTAPLSLLPTLAVLLVACGKFVSLGGGSGSGGAGGGPDPGDPASSSSSDSVTTSSTTGIGGGGSGTGGEGGGDVPDAGIGGGGNGGNPGTSPCDDDLALDDADPFQAARAIELCTLAEGPDGAGLLEARWVLPDGTSIPSGYDMQYALGHGLYDGFGPNVLPRAGKRMLALSSGAARRPGETGYQAPFGGYAKGYQHAAPTGFPKPSPACPGVLTGQPYDGVALEVTLRAPIGTVGFAFAFNYYTAEFPSFVCSTFNDAFVALLSPTPPGQTDDNISFDGQGNVISVNNVFLEVCTCQDGPPCTAGGKVYPCSLGASALAGTGYDTGQGTGATGWLTTTAPMQGGKTFTVRFAVYDSGDAILDSVTLIDHFRWISTGAPVVETYRPVPP